MKIIESDELIPVEKVDPATVQSVLFSKDKFTVEQAKKWLADHNYKNSKVDSTSPNYHRFRQFEPSLCKDDSFRNITFAEGIKAVICKKKSQESELSVLIDVAKLERDSYHRVFEEHCEKFGVPPVIGMNFNVTHKELGEEEGTLVPYISTVDKDRDGDIVRPEGMKNDNYRKNPVVLWAHRSGDLPIGKSLWEKADDKGIRSKLQFDLKREFSREVFRMYSEDFLKAFSIGFRPLKLNRMEEEGRFMGYEFIEWELLEYSGCPVPANPNALNNAFNAGVVRDLDLLMYLSMENCEFDKYVKSFPTTPVDVALELRGCSVEFRSALEAFIKETHEKQEQLFKFVESMSQELKGIKLIWTDIENETDAEPHMHIDLTTEDIEEVEKIKEITTEKPKTEILGEVDIDIEAIIDRTLAGEISRIKGKVD